MKLGSRFLFSFILYLFRNKVDRLHEWDREVRQETKFRFVKLASASNVNGFFFFLLPPEHH
jgi:hypothetical protein